MRARGQKMVLAANRRRVCGTRVIQTMDKLVHGRWQRRQGERGH